MSWQPLKVSVSVSMSRALQQVVAVARPAAGPQVGVALVTRWTLQLDT